MLDILYYTVAAIIFLALFLSFIRLFKTKVWIKTRMHNGPLQKIGYMDCNDAAEAPEVHLSGESMGTPLGRVIIPDNSDNANVELQTENIHTDSGRSSFKTCGFITPEGLIYKKIGKRSPEYIGYTARPSAPDVPAVCGERSWRQLWLRCTLNVYKGHPGSNDKASADTKKKKEKKNTGKTPIAVCSYTGLHDSRRDMMPPEARAGAFAAIYGRLNRRDYREYYNSTAYGWKDTALLAAVIYIVVYMVIYLVKVKINGETLIGPVKQTIALCALFFGIWALLRAIKIEFIERSDTIQPRIDLFNKALGQRKFDAFILIASGIIIAYSDSFYNLDFIPVAVAADIGIAINMTLRSCGLRWKIEDVFKTDSDEDDSLPTPEYENPPGEISINYKWTLDAPTKQGFVGDVTLYFDSQYISDLRHINPFFNQRNDKPLRAYVTEMFGYMNSHASVSARCRYLARRIAELASENSLTEAETLQFMLDFVQEPNITFRPNANSKAINRLESYIRFPDEVLFDKEADATSKVLLAAALFHFHSRRVLFLYSRKTGHSAIGVEAPAELAESETIFGIPREDATFTYNGVVYIFCETTGDGLRLGGTLTGMRHSDFDERIELPEDEYDYSDDGVTCLYQWSLDSLIGNRLEGAYTLEFSRSEIDSLRHKNPFRTYGSDSNTYEGNIKQMFDYLHSDRARTAKVREIAKYIYGEIKNLGLPEIDLVQFALDFCQMPNIQYCVDADSAGIDFAKEYMRFPDEVLFDKEGDCDCKSSLTASLFHELGYNVVILISSKLKHAAIAIEYNPAWEAHLPPERLGDAVKEHNGRRYLFCETTGDGYKVGGIEENSSIHDFEIVVEIPA